MKKALLIIIALFAVHVSSFAQCIADAGENVAICSVSIMPYDTVQIGGTNAASGGVPPYSYIWTKPLEGGNPYTAASYTLDDHTSPNPTILRASMDIFYTLTVTDAAGNTCVDSVNVKSSMYDQHLAGWGANIQAGDSVLIPLHFGPNVMGGIPPVQYVWRPNESIRDSVGASVWAKPETTTEYSVFVTDSIGCTYDGDPFFIVIVNPLSIKKENIDPQLSIYPNPATGNVYIENISQSVKVEIMDLKGKKVQSTSLNSGDKTVDVSQLANGVYFMRISDGDYILWTEKLMIE